MRSQEVPKLRVDLSIAGSQRRRTLALRAAEDGWLVDFSAAVPMVLRRGERVDLPQELETFGSSLRLELGAFHLETRAPGRGSAEDRAPIFEWLAPCARFHRMMVGAFDGPRVA